jgi:hypothetical protein
VSPWILVLDADERIATRDLALLARALHSGPDGFRLVQRNYMMANHIVDWTPNDGSYPEGDGYPGFIDNPLVRLFRNSPEIRFLGSVHETVDPARMPAKFPGRVFLSLFTTTENCANPNAWRQSSVCISIWD